MKILKITLFFLLVLPFFAFANWQFMPTKGTTYTEAAPPQTGEFKQVKNPSLTLAEPWKSSATLPAQFGSMDNNYEPYHLTIYPGTLKSNLERLMKGNAYAMLWLTKYDYPVIGKAIISGKTFNEALNKLLENYPVRATFYKQNHIMTVVERKSA